MKEAKPIKRSKQLAPFSRDHHDTLLFIWKIKQGFKNKTSTEIIGAYAQWFWNNHMKEHFDQEEKLLLPHLHGNELGIRLKKEHETIRNLVMNAMNETSISLLATTLNDHIRFEERQLFPLIEEKVSPDELDRIFEQLDHQKQCESEWSNRFWTKQKR